MTAVIYLVILLVLSLSLQLYAKPISLKKHVLSTTKSNDSTYIHESILKLVKIKGGKKEAKSFISTIIKSVTNFFNSMFKTKSKYPKLNQSKKDAAASLKSKKTRASSNSPAAGGSAESRIQKEIKSFLSNPPLNCELVVGSNIRTWVVNMKGLDGTIYAGEQFKLKMVFPKDYPSKPPSVFFLKPTPKHVHVYSNGDICLNLLGKDWRPSMTAELLVVSIQSMLASAKEKKSPQDNAAHSDSAPGQQQEGWMYHDDRC